MGFVLHDYQTTLKSRETLTGTGVHSGKPVTVHCLPADPDTGVVFQLSNGGEGRAFSARVSDVGGTDQGTRRGEPLGGKIATTIGSVTTAL